MLDNDLSMFIIPAVHIRNYKEACWYTYGGAYTPCIGHFYGETAEMIWPFMNQFAGQTQQMTNGHRQDTIIRNLEAWNWCKVQRMHKYVVANYEDVSEVCHPSNTTYEGTWRSHTFIWREAGLFSWYLQDSPKRPSFVAATISKGSKGRVQDQVCLQT